MSHFDEQSLSDLEFPVIRKWLTDYGHGPTAKQRLNELRPSNHFPSIELELQKLNELVAIKTEGESFPALNFEELHHEIKLLPIRNAVLSQEGFSRLLCASELVNAYLMFFEKRQQKYPLLHKLFEHTYFTEDIKNAINKVFDRAGNVKDDASKHLFELRQKIKTIRNQINRNFEREMRKLLKENLLGETKEAFVNERRVLTILSAHKRKISGNVLGSSKTGSLTFVEPQLNVPLNNELELLLDDERKEIYRILLSLTKELASFFPLVQAYQKVLTELDFINAKAKLAVELNCCLPGIVKDTEIELINAFHPVLWKSNKLNGKKTYAQSIAMDKHSRMLVISGPNAGGKSITLKTIGLLQVMLQSGLLVPVDPNSNMCFFQQILTDIGDNQSIENELSTYSYRLKRMKFFLEVANKRTLLLLDEFGTGSDPELGGALAEVFFEELYNRKSFAVITTHYSNIKLKADALKNAINGCMLFNTDTLEPLYRFSMGQPGSSFTFEVAQINGIKGEIIDLAKKKMSDQKIQMDQLLNQLQKEKTYLERLNKEHIDAQRIASEAKERYDEQRIKFEQRSRALNESAERNNKFNNAGKKMLDFIERYNLKSRKKDVNDALLQDMKKYLAVEKSRIEQAKKIKSESISKPTQTKKSKAQLSAEASYQQEKIVVGSKVKLITTRQSGTVEHIQGETITVTFGFARMKVERSKLIWVE